MIQALDLWIIMFFIINGKTGCVVYGHANIHSTVTVT